MADDEKDIEWDGLDWERMRGPVPLVGQREDEIEKRKGERKL